MRLQEESRGRKIRGVRFNGTGSLLRYAPNWTYGGPHRTFRVGKRTVRHSALSTLGADFRARASTTTRFDAWDWWPGVGAHSMAYPCCG